MLRSQLFNAIPISVHLLPKYLYNYAPIPMQPDQCDAIGIRITGRVVVVWFVPTPTSNLDNTFCYGYVIKLCNNTFFIDNYNSKSYSTLKL